MQRHLSRARRLDGVRTRVLRCRCGGRSLRLLTLSFVDLEAEEAHARRGRVMVPVRANSADLYGPSHSLLPFKSVYAAESTPEDHDASVHVSRA